MIDTVTKIRKIPEPLDNKTLQRMMDEHMRYVHAHDGASPGVDLSLYIISDFDFSGLILRGIHAYKTTFHRCRFVGTDFYYSDFSETAAPNADFREAILAKSVFSEANMRGANFDRANLIQTDFMECDLREATFRNVDFSGGMISDCQTEGAVYDPKKVQPL